MTGKRMLRPLAKPWLQGMLGLPDSVGSASTARILQVKDGVVLICGGDATAPAVDVRQNG